MPYRSKKPCAHPGCPNLTDGRFCAAHAKQDAREYEKYKRAPETRKRYGSEWRRIRARYIAAHPLCEQCESEGRITPAEHIHHVIELSMGGSHGESNLRSLCAAHHSSLHLRERNQRCD